MSTGPAPGRLGFGHPATCCTGRVDHVVQNALDAIERRDWGQLKRVLHPYVRWTENEATLRGRTKVLAHLTAHPVANRPTSYQLRDGQIYHWTIDAGSPAPPT
jgi:hypothetical protein